MTIALGGAPTQTDQGAQTDHTDTITVSDYVVSQLISARITTAFGVHGANIEDVFDAAVRADGITPVIAKHEFAAGAMADGTARISGLPAVVLTTSGGGAMNVVPALAEAYDSRVPVLAIIGTAPTTLVGRGAFQDMLSPPDTIDLTAVMTAVTGSASAVTAVGGVPAALSTAFATLRRGLPAAVLLPKDIQSAPLPKSVAYAPVTDEGPDAARTDPHSAARILGQVAVQSVTAELAAAQRICLWVGEEASRAGVGERVRRLAALLGATVVAAPGGRDILRADRGITTAAAGVTGVMGHPSAHRAIVDADLCLVVGCRLTMTDRAGLDDALAQTRVIHLGAEPPRAPGLADHGPTDDLPAALDQIIDEFTGQYGARPPAHIAPVEYLATPPGSPDFLDMRSVIEEIGAALPAESVIFADAGNTGAAAIHHLPFGGGRFVVALGMGGMGYGLAAGIGNAIHAAAQGDSRRTVIIAGDGAFLMHGMELHTAVEYGAPVTVVILNNNAHGMCITREHLFFPEVASINRFRPADIAAGLDAMFPRLSVAHAVERADLRRTAADLLSRDGPTCLVVDVDPDEIPPFAPFLPKGTS